MTNDQWAILAILAATVAMFLWGRWRHDMVATGALLACVLTGLIEPAEAFLGFGHPAVITVACVLVLSHGLQSSGAVDALTRAVLPANAGRLVTLAALMALGAILSGFMNNVGAMALLMPVAIQVAQRLDLTPGQVLMPLAFGTILGGMTTLIGTPPNLIVSSFRAQNGSGPFAMFDFSPVGVAVAVAGVLFITQAADLMRWDAVKGQNTVRRELEPPVPSAYSAQTITSVLLAPPASPHDYTRLFAHVFGLSETTRAALQHRVETREAVLMRQFEPASSGPRVGAATLVVHDREDRINPVADGLAFAQAIPQSDWLETSGLGHVRLLKAPAVLDAVVAHVA